LKQLIIQGKDITEYLEDSKLELQTNYNQEALSNLKSMAEVEKNYYDVIISPFVDKTKITQATDIKDKIKLGVYDFLGLNKAKENLNRKIKEKNIVYSFEKTKNGLERQLEQSNKRKAFYELEIRQEKRKLTKYLGLINSIYANIEFSNKAIKKLEHKKSDLEKKKDYSAKDTDKIIELSDAIIEVQSDLDKIQDSAIENLDDADQLKRKIIDTKMQIQENEKLFYFYKDMKSSYSRRFDTISDISLKLDKGFSFEKAYEQAKRFVQEDEAFTKFDILKKEQYKKHNTELLRFNKPYIKEKLPITEIKNRQIDHKLKISEGLDDLKNFISDIQQT
jgi:hypothetical protein